MSDVLIIGDIHYGDSVASRKDDYPTTILEQLYKFCEYNKNCHIICLGDLFNLVSLNFRNLGNFQTVISLIKNKFNCHFYSIIGNHDCRNDLDSDDDMINTPLGYLNRSGIITMISANSNIIIGNNIFVSSYVNKGKCVDHLTNYNDSFNDHYNKFLLLHHCDINNDLLHSLPFKAIFLGHEHCPYSNDTLVSSSNNNIYLPGSFTRKEALDFNYYDRYINYYRINNDGDVTLNKFSYIKDAKDVFRVNSLERTNYKINQYKKVVKSITNKINIDDIISKYNNINKYGSIYSINDALIEIKTPKIIHETILKEYSEV